MLRFGSNSGMSHEVSPGLETWQQPNTTPNTLLMYHFSYILLRYIPKIDSDL